MDQNGTQLPLILKFAWWKRIAFSLLALLFIISSFWMGWWKLSTGETDMALIITAFGLFFVVVLVGVLIRPTTTLTADDEGIIVFVGTGRTKEKIPWSDIVKIDIVMPIA
jgi:hypothetical protein